MSDATANENANPSAPRVQEIAGFELIEKIGQGGMGSVYKARQKSLDRLVALKILPPSAAKDTKFIDRFQREARASAKLNHPNIVQGIDVGKDPASGLWYFAMEYVDGHSLLRELREQKVLPEERVARIAREMAKALQCSSNAGIVHRDIKPDNILITQRGEVKLTDLGLAKQMADDTQQVTQSGTTMGTPLYMAPEQVRGEHDKIDIRTDIYALGATMFHLVTGAPPFSGPTSAVVMSKHLSESPPFARNVNPAVSAAFSKLIEKMMQKEQSRRVQTPWDLLQALDNLSAAPAVAEPAIAAPAEQPKSSSLAAAAGIALLLGGAILFLTMRSPQQTAGKMDADGKTPSIAMATPSSSAVVEKTGGTKTDNPAGRGSVDELLKSAREFEQKNPDQYDEIIQRFQLAFDAAAGTPQEAAVTEEAQKVQERTFSRIRKAKDEAWRNIETKIDAALKAQNYDEAIAECENIPAHLILLLREVAAERLKRLHQEARQNLNAISRLADTSARAGDPAAALRILADADKIKYAPARDAIDKMRLRFKIEEEKAVETKKKKDAQMAQEDKLNEYLKRFDDVLIDHGDVRTARSIAEAAAADPKLGEMQPRAKAMIDILNAMDENARQFQEMLAKLKGQKVDLDLKSGKISGKVQKLQDGVLFVEIDFGGGATGVKQVKLAELNDDQRASLGQLNIPDTDAQRVAAAIQKLKKGSEDFKGAGMLLATAPAFPLAIHYREVWLQRSAEASRQAGEASAPAAFSELQARASATKLSEADARALLEKIAKFEREYQDTLFAASVKDKLVAFREKCEKAASVNALANGDFEAGALTGWAPSDKNLSGKIELAPGVAAEGKFAVKFLIPGGNGAAIEQPVNVENGAVYKLSAQIKPIKGIGFLRIRAHVFGPKGELSASPNFDSILPAGDWRTIECTFTASGNSARIVLLAGPKAAGDWEVLLDDVKLLRIK